MLSLVDLYPDGFSVDGGVGGLTLDSKFPKFSNEGGNLLLLSLVNLVLEFVHS